MKRVIITNVIALLLGFTAVAQDRKVAVFDSTDKLDIARGGKFFMSGRELSKTEVRTLIANTDNLKVYRTTFEGIPIIEDALSVYNKGIKKNNAGTALVIWGASFIAGGAILAFAGGFYDEWDEWVTKPTGWGGTHQIRYSKKKWSTGALVGVPLMSVGAMGLIVGVPLKFSGKKDIRDVVDVYNSKKSHASAELKFGVNGNGVGLVLNF